MESSVVVCDRIDEYLDAQLTCKQCLGLLRKPQVLYPCGHSFCEPCVETLRDADSKRLVCCDCDGVCEAVTVTNAALDAIISQYNWWKVSLDDLRKKYAGAQVSLAGENNGDWEFAVAVSSSANETNPVLRPSLAALNRQFSKLK